MDFNVLLGTWIAAILTILITSIAFRETPLSRWADFTYVGANTASAVVFSWFTAKAYSVDRISAGQYIYILGMILGILSYARYSRKYFWLYRYPMALLVGAGVGSSMRGYIGSNFLDQIQANFFQLIVPGDLYKSFNNTVMAVTVISCMIYFIFTVKAVETPTARKISMVGRYLLMAAFGVSFSNTIASRVNQYAGRITFLLFEWLQLKPLA